MLQNENNYISVNNFMSIPKIPYQIVVHLLENKSNEYIKLHQVRFNHYANPLFKLDLRKF